MQSAPFVFTLFSVAAFLSNVALGSPIPVDLVEVSREMARDASVRAIVDSSSAYVIAKEADEAESIVARYDMLDASYIDLITREVSESSEASGTVEPRICRWDCV